jgi:hypothetical protein
MALEGKPFNLAESRYKNGECIECGNKTHQFNSFGERTALTIHGMCVAGRCLLCKPLEGNSRMPMDFSRYRLQFNPLLQSNQDQFPSDVPKELVIQTSNCGGDYSDDVSIVSGITLDPFLMVNVHNSTMDSNHEELILDGRRANMRRLPNLPVAKTDGAPRLLTRPGLVSEVSNYRPSFSRCDNSQVQNRTSRPHFPTKRQEGLQAATISPGERGMLPSQARSQIHYVQGNHNIVAKGLHSNRIRQGNYHF